MNDKELNQEELEQLESGCNCDCEEPMSDEIMQLSLDKEYDRLARRFLFDDESVEAFAQSKEFQEGMTEAMKICGMYSTFISYGIDEKDAMDIILNKMNIDHNILTAKMANETSIEVSKNQMLQVEKNSL